MFDLSNKLKKNLKWRKFNIEIIHFALLKLNMKWEKTLNLGTWIGGSTVLDAEATDSETPI
jgi:hypothetical protein